MSGFPRPKFAIQEHRRGAARHPAPFGSQRKFRSWKTGHESGILLLEISNPPVTEGLPEPFSNPWRRVRDFCFSHPERHPVLMPVYQQNASPRPGSPPRDPPFPQWVLDYLANGVPDGKRNNTLHAVARSFRGFNVPFSLAYPRL